MVFDLQSYLYDSNKKQNINTNQYNIRNELVIVYLPISVVVVVVVVDVVVVFVFISLLQTYAWTYY